MPKLNKLKSEYNPKMQTGPDEDGEKFTWS